MTAMIIIITIIIPTVSAAVCARALVRFIRYVCVCVITKLLNLQYTSLKREF